MKNIVQQFVSKYFTSFYYFYKTLKYRIFITLLLSLTVGILDGLGLTMFIPLLQAVSGQTGVESTNLGNLSFLLEALVLTGIPLTLYSILIVMLCFFLFKGIMKFVEGYINAVYQQYFIKKVRLKLIMGISNLDYEAFVKSDSGMILNTVSGEVEKVNQAFRAYFMTIQATVLLMVYVVLAFITSVQFALLITMGGLLSNLLFKNLYKQTKLLSRKVVKLAHRYQSIVLQQVSAFKYLKASGLMSQYANKVNEMINLLEFNYVKIGRLKALVQAIREPVTIFVVVIVIIIQVRFFDVNLTTIILSLLFFYRAMSYLMSLQLNWNTFLSQIGSLDNMAEFNAMLFDNIESAGKIKLDSFSDSIRLKNIDFAYGNTQVLKDINMVIKKNQMVALVGESGSGKTTLVNLIAGLLKPSDGQISIDNHDYNELYMPSYRKRLGYITQEPVVFGDTIFNNVTFWYDKESDINKFQNVIKKVKIDGFINSLVEGEHTLLGANGLDISGGQRQRLVIARELYKDIDVLIMDEATSALDSQTEKEIQRSIDELKGSVTLISIAHRLSTIKNADTIFLMKDGMIVQSGSFEQLINSSTDFKRMIELQSLH